MYQLPLDGVRRDLSQVRLILRLGLSVVIAAAVSIAVISSILTLAINVRSQRLPIPAEKRLDIARKTAEVVVSRYGPDALVFAGGVCWFLQRSRRWLVAFLVAPPLMILAGVLSSLDMPNVAAIEARSRILLPSSPEFWALIFGGALLVAVAEGSRLVEGVLSRSANESSLM